MKSIITLTICCLLSLFSFAQNTQTNKVYPKDCDREQLQKEFANFVKQSGMPGTINVNTTYHGPSDEIGISLGPVKEKEIADQCNSMRSAIGFAVALYKEVLIRYPCIKKFIICSQIKYNNGTISKGYEYQMIYHYEDGKVRYTCGNGQEFAFVIK